MLSRRNRPGSSSTRRIRPRSGAVLWDLGCIWTIFAFPNRSFDIGDGVEPGAHVVERELELPVFLECRLQLLGSAVVAFGGGRGSRSLQAAGLRIENQARLDVLQMYQGERALLGQQRIASREQLAEQRLCFRFVARGMRRRGER